MFGLFKKSPELTAVDNVVNEMIDLASKIAPMTGAKLLAFYALHSSNSKRYEFDNGLTPCLNPIQFDKDFLLGLACRTSVLADLTDDIWKEEIKERNAAIDQSVVDDPGSIHSKDRIEIIVVESFMYKLMVCTYAYGLLPKRATEITVNIWDRLSINKFKVSEALPALIETLGMYPEVCKSITEHGIPTEEEWKELINNLRVEF